LLRSGAFVAQFSVPSFGDAAHWATLRLERRGAAITVLVDGVVVGNWTDPTPLTGTKIGFGFGQGSGVCRQDNWQGGDLAPSPCVPFLTDNFNRADSGDLGYPPWLGFDFGGMKIVSNHAEQGWNGTDIRGGARADLVLSDNQWAEADIVANIYGPAGVVTRYGNEDVQYFAMLEYNNGAPRLGLFVRTPGYTYTLIGSYVAVASPVARVRLESFGSTHRVYYNNVLTITQTDATYTSGRPGIVAYNTTWPGGRSTVDNFACGELLY
jgi:hypothetical protein